MFWILTTRLQRQRAKARLRDLTHFSPKLCWFVFMNTVCIGVFCCWYMVVKLACQRLLVTSGDCVIVERRSLDGE